MRNIDPIIQMETQCRNNPLEIRDNHEKTFSQIYVHSMAANRTDGTAQQVYIYLQVGGVQDGTIPSAEHETAIGVSCINPDLLLPSEHHERLLNYTLHQGKLITKLAN